MIYANIMRMVDSINRHDSTALHPTSLSLGDVRALVARVRELEEAAQNKRRGELLRVATALMVPSNDGVVRQIDNDRRLWAVIEARRLVEAVDRL